MDSRTTAHRRGRFLWYEDALPPFNNSVESRPPHQTTSGHVIPLLFITLPSVRQDRFLTSSSFVFLVFQFVLSGLAGFLALKAKLGPMCIPLAGMGPWFNVDKASCEVKPPRSPIRSLTSLDRA